MWTGESTGAQFYTAQCVSHMDRGHRWDQLMKCTQNADFAHYLHHYKCGSCLTTDGAGQWPSPLQVSERSLRNTAQDCWKRTCLGLRVGIDVINNPFRGMSSSIVFWMLILMSRLLNPHSHPRSSSYQVSLQAQIKMQMGFNIPPQF